MNDPVPLFEELVALTELYLLQEHHLKDWIESDPDAYRFFKERAKQGQPKTEPAPVSTPPLPAASAQRQSPQIVSSASNLKTKPALAKPEPQETQPKPVRETPLSRAVSQSLTLEPLGKAKEADLSEMQRIVKEKLPQVRCIQEIPGPAAKQVVVVAMDATSEELSFIQNVTGAIERLLMPAELVTLEKSTFEEQWADLLKQPHLRWLIAFGDLPGILKGSEPQKLSQVTLLLEDKAEIILRNPALKAALWKKLKSLLR